jgi:mono/diheme cytochrome c family protein
MARRIRHSWLAGLAALTLGGCATTGEPDASGLPASALPAGRGRAILERECLKCHELDALDLFKGFYTRDQWASLVATMRANGARVDDDELDVLAAYLERYFGVGAD